MWLVKIWYKIKSIIRSKLRSVAENGITFANIKQLFFAVVGAILIFVLVADGIAELTADRRSEYETRIEIVGVDWKSGDYDESDTYYVIVNIKGEEYKEMVRYYEYKYAKAHIGQRVPARVKERTVNFLGEEEIRVEIEFIELDDTPFWKKIFN